MKVSKQRAKARSAFRRGTTFRRYDDGTLARVGDLVPAGVVTVEVAIVRSRRWTKPQCARQRDS